MLTRQEFDRLNDDEKFDYLHRHAIAAYRAGEAMAANVEDLRTRLAAIEARRGAPPRDGLVHRRPEKGRGAIAVGKRRLTGRAR